MAKYSLPQPIPLPNPYSLFRGFNFIRPIRIENSGAALKDYQVKITLTQDNFPFEKCRPDGADIRFRDDSGEIVPYWIESWSDNQAIIWCKVPYIPEDESTFLWMVYGNPTAESQSSISQTFIREINGNQPVEGSWHIDEGYGGYVYDSSGNSNTGTIVNAGWTDGKFGKALAFDGSTAYVNVGNPSSLNQAFSHLSVAAWVKFDSFTDSNENIAVSKDGDDGRSWDIGVLGSSHSAFMCVFTSDGYACSDSGTTLTTDVWYFLAGVYDGSNVKIYVNNTLEDTDNLTGTVNTNPTDVFFARRAYSGLESWVDGIIDEVLIIDKALSTEEISDLYNYYGYTTINYPGRVLIRKYVYPEPTIIL